MSRPPDLTRQGSRAIRRPGFTLIEMLVVLGITAVLMLILFIPLSRSQDLVSRANARIDGQDQVRKALRLVTRDLTNAMELLDPRGLTLWGFSSWTLAGDRYVPAAGAVPDPYVIRDGVVALRLPKHRYFCTQFDHYITPRDIDLVFPPPRPFDDAVALDSCPRHPGAPVELRPISPLEPDDRVTAYFVGLKNPAPRAGGLPLYENLLLFNNTRNLTLNTYAVYRVEFDPRGVNAPPTTVTDANVNGLDDRYETFFTDPSFFYDATPVTVTVNGTAQTKERYQWWLDITNTVMDSATADVVRWLESGASRTPHSLVRFAPTPVEDEVAQPNREAGQYSIAGSVSLPDLPPLEYGADFGHWIGLQSDGSTPLRNAALSGTQAGGAVALGPHIRILDASNPRAVVPVYDTLTALRGRLVAFDSLTGRVVSAVTRVHENFTDPNPQVQSRRRQAFSAPIDPVTYTLDLTQDQPAYTNPFSLGLPSGFGSALAAYGAVTSIVPGSERIELVDFSGSVPAVQPLRRAGWSLGGTNTGEYVAQPDLEQDEYTIDYRTGAIGLSTRDPAVWTGVGPSSPVQVLVYYRFQTNRPTDVVRVSYVTREAMHVHLGIVNYTRRQREVLPFEVSERVVIRNLKR